MLFRSLLLCALVSYVVAVAASPTEDSSPGSKKVEVENVESATSRYRSILQQDSDLTDLEDISIEGEVINLDSQEHPESAGLFRRIGEKIGDASAKIKSAGRNAADKFRILADKTKDAGRSVLRGVSRKPSSRPERKPGSRPGSKPVHRLGSRPGHRLERNPGRRPGNETNRRPVDNLEDAHRHGKPLRNNEGIKIYLSSDSQSKETKTAKKPGILAQTFQSFGTSFGTGLGKGIADLAVNNANRAINNAINNIGADSKEPQKVRDNQYKRHAEDDRHRNDDSNRMTSDHEEDGKKCKDSAITHCFDKFKDVDLIKTCMAEYKCSKD